MSTNVARRPPIDEWIWRLFVKACGGRCCECLKDDCRLDRGHIQRHADDGPASFENLIPLCRSCNSKHKGGFTPDSRPDDWRDKFFKLLLTEMNVGIQTPTSKLDSNICPTSHPVESTGVIDLAAVRFVPGFHYKESNATAPAPLSTSAARKLVNDLFKKSKACDIRPKRPLGKRQDAMMLLAKREGREAFRFAGDEFLLEMPWVLDAQRGTVAQDSWQHFCESFESYASDGQERTKQRAENDRLERAWLEARKKEDDVRQYENRWTNHMLVADVPFYDGITDADRARIEAVQTEKAAGAEARTITDDEDMNDRGLLGRHWKYLQRELEQGKEKLRIKLRQIQTKDVDGEFTDQIESCRGWLNAVKDVDILKRDEGKWIDALALDVDNHYTPMTDEAWADLIKDGKF